MVNEQCAFDELAVVKARENAFASKRNAEPESVRGENANPSQAIATSRFAPCAVNEFMNRDRQIARLVVVNSKLSGRTVL